MRINAELLPMNVKNEGKTTYRSLKIEDEEFEFSGGFADLHTLSYQNILSGDGFHINETKTAIDIVYNIRNQEAIGCKGDYHPLAERPTSRHPFNIS